MVMGFNIVPTQPFGYNYLGGKLLSLLCCSHEMKRQFDERYGTDLRYTLRRQVFMGRVRIVVSMMD